MFLYGRHPVNGEGGSHSSSNRHFIGDPTMPWLADKYQEIKPHPQLANHIYWLLNYYKSHGRLPSPKHPTRTDNRRLLRRGRASARCLSRVAGYCVSMAKAVSPTKLLRQNLYRLLRSRQSWEHILQLNSAVKKDLEWWQSTLHSWNGKPISTHPISLQIETDASQTGWGAWASNGKMATDVWNQTMSMAPSNARELMAVMMAILSFREDIANTAVQILTDNISTAAYIMQLGGKSAGLTAMAAKICELCYCLNVEISARYLAGKENTKADSPVTDISPSGMTTSHPSVFRMLDHVWGRHTMDRFASMANHQTPQYNSRFWHPWSQGVDAFVQQNWKEHNNFVNCPFNLLPKVLNKIWQSKAIATVIAPWWPGRPWFRKLHAMSVDKPLLLPKRRAESYGQGEYAQNHSGI